MNYCSVSSFHNHSIKGSGIKIGVLDRGQLRIQADELIDYNITTHYESNGMFDDTCFDGGVGKSSYRYTLEHFVTHRGKIVERAHFCVDSFDNPNLIMNNYWNKKDAKQNYSTDEKLRMGTFVTGYKSFDFDCSGYLGEVVIVDLLDGWNGFYRKSGTCTVEDDGNKIKCDRLTIYVYEFDGNKVEPVSKTKFGVVQVSKDRSAMFFNGEKYEKLTK